MITYTSALTKLLSAREEILQFNDLQLEEFSHTSTGMRLFMEKLGELSLAPIDVFKMDDKELLALPINMKMLNPKRRIA